MLKILTEINKTVQIPQEYVSRIDERLNQGGQEAV
jgi:hypothetical protein